MAYREVEMWEILESRGVSDGGIGCGFENIDYEEACHQRVSTFVSLAGNPAYPLDGKRYRKVHAKGVPVSQPEFVTDRKGRKKAVLLDIKSYQKLLAELEDLEDANDLLKAERDAKGFIPYDPFRRSFLRKR